MVQTFLPYIVCFIRLAIKKYGKKSEHEEQAEFELEEKYALLMGMVTVCFFFGTAIPVVFMIAAVSFVFQSIVDRLLITYVLDFPPVYDDILNLKFVRSLKYAPLVFVPSFLGIVLFLSIRTTKPFKKTFKRILHEFLEKGD